MLKLCGLEVVSKAVFLCPSLTLDLTWLEIQCLSHWDHE